MGDEIARVHDKIDKLLEQGIRTETKVLSIEEKLQAYQRPCPPLIAVIKDYDDRARFWDGVKSKVLMFGLFGAITVVTGAVIFALKNGYMG